MKRIFISGILIIFTSLGFAWVTGFNNIQSNESFNTILDGRNATPTGFSRADGSHNWDFPPDFGPHPDYQTEWWYYTGNLETIEGRKFGYQLTFFRRGLTPAQDFEERDSLWGGNQVYMGHFALSDISAEEHYNYERFSRGAAGLAGAQSEPFQVWVENWQVEQVASDEWRLIAEQDDVTLELLLVDIKGLIFQGNDGYSQKGPEVGNASYYFSQPRLASEGTIFVSGEEYQVTGLSWMDHEFSTSALSAGQVGWDWFSLQLDDGTDLMVFQIRRTDGGIDPFSSGTVIGSDDEMIYLKQSQFEIEVNDTWRSPHSGATYPAAWTIEIPQIDLTLDIQPFMDDQELNVSYAYWEGAVNVTGSLGDEVVTGSGYVELTGYAASMEGEF